MCNLLTLGGLNIKWTVLEKNEIKWSTNQPLSKNISLTLKTFKELIYHQRISFQYYTLFFIKLLCLFKQLV